ncbi:MAG: SDR family NAD(P)-dependent oxidoreductase [Marinicella sp.]
MTILVTGAAGFIGSHVCRKLIDQKEHVIGVDNLNSYYAVQLKKDRLKLLESPEFTFVQQDITDVAAMVDLFEHSKPKKVVHLAAEAGVQHGSEQPELFINSNVVGFNNILENCRKFAIEHLIYASSASVYGDNVDFPLTEKSNSDQPLTLYAATKKANEVLAHSYAHLYQLNITGLRFFTVYGPWGRPDMALYKFTDCIENNHPINIHNHGNHTRDLIYIDDLVDALMAILNQPATAGHQIYNLGSQQAIGLMDMVKTLEHELGHSTPHVLLPRQAGEIEDNRADASAFINQYGVKPQVELNEGISRFVKWYRDYNQSL